MIHHPGVAIEPAQNRFFWVVFLGRRSVSIELVEMGWVENEMTDTQ